MSDNMQLCGVEPNSNANLDARNKSPDRWKQVIFALILALPALWTAHLIFLYGVDVPWLDQWDLLYPMLEKMGMGTLRFSDFFASFGGHEMFFPQLIQFGLAKLTHWNIRAELLLNWFLDCLTAANLWRLTLVTGIGQHRKYWLLLPAYILWFTPMKMEIWVNGAEIQFPLTAACLTACLWIALSARFPLNYLLTMALCMICTFSVASGIVCWVLTCPLLWLSSRSLSSRQKAAWGLFWLAAFLANLLLWLRGFIRPSPDSNLTGFISHPFEAIQFFLTYLGSAFALGTEMNHTLVAQVAGAVLVLALLLAVKYVWRCRRDTTLMCQTLPWLMLAAFALANASVTTVGRLDLGKLQALSSRYLGHSLALPIGLLFLVTVVFNHWRAGRADLRKATTLSIGFTSTVTAFFLFYALGVLTQHKRPELHSNVPCPPGREAWQVVHHDRLALRALLLLINVVDEPETLRQMTLINEPRVLKVRANFLDRIGYLRPRLVRTNALRGILGTTLREPRQFGEIQRVGRPAQGQIALAGWACLPDKGRRADAVVLTYDDSGGEPIMFALAMVQVPRTDLTDHSSRPAFPPSSGWIKAFDVSRLPPGDHVVRAWAYDADDCRAYPLRGSVNVVANPAENPPLKE